MFRGCLSNVYTLTFYLMGVMLLFIYFFLYVTSNIEYSSKKKEKMETNSCCKCCRISVF